MDASRQSEKTLAALLQEVSVAENQRTESAGMAAMALALWAVDRAPSYLLDRAVEHARSAERWRSARDALLEVCP